MKVQKYADRWKGKEVKIKTSGGGNFEGWGGNYDRESNIIDVWNGFTRTRVDADKIVSVNASSPIAAFIFIIAFVGFCVLLLNVIKDPRDRGYRDYDDYRPYKYERHYR